MSEWNEQNNSSRMQSIYSVITSHLIDGALPETFSLGPEYNTGFAPGAQDGIAIYHMHPLQPGQERKEKVLEVLKLISDEDQSQYFDRIMSIFEELDQKDGIVRLYDLICQTLGSHVEELNLERLVGFGDYLICYGISILSIKVGLSLLGGFNIPFVEDVALEFGAYEEFTYYAARILSNAHWKDGNEKLFRLAKQLHGWGRIFAVDYLKPETQEIKDWILFEGAKNSINPQYSADMCLLKTDAIGRLGSSVSQKEYAALSWLIAEALDGGPCPGLTDPEQLLGSFLRAAKEHPLDKNLIQEIRDWSEQNLSNHSIAEIAQGLMNM